MSEPLDPSSEPTSTEAPPPEPAVPPEPAISWAAPSPSPTVNPMKFCVACGAQIDARAEICPACGVRQPAVGGGPGKSRPVAALLALLLGGLGIHKFYLGKTVLGVVYLVFCWTGIPALVAWIEGISYLTSSDESWAQRYGGPAQRSSRAAIGCLWLVALGPLLLVLGFIAAIFLGSQIGSMSSMGLGTGGTGCDLARTASTFAVADPIRMTAQFSPDLPAGTVVTVHLTREGSEVDGYPQSLKLDVATDCVSGTISQGPLTTGHYVITVGRDGAATPPLSGAFDVTP